MPLQQISIRGGLFCRVQDRNYWQFDQYVRVFKPDAAAEQRAFERFVKHPYPEGVRLDSIVEGREKISYYYTQEVPTKGEGKTMHVTLAGAVVGLDGSRYDMPPLDTLEYNISSMLTFTDTTRRYLIKVIEKYAVVKDRNYLAFEVGKSDIIDTLETNAVQARPYRIPDGRTDKPAGVLCGQYRADRFGITGRSARAQRASGPRACPVAQTASGRAFRAAGRYADRRALRRRELDGAWGA